MKRSVGIFISTCLFLGCVTEGRDFPSQLTWLKKGQTKESDVKMVLGDPQRVGNADGVVTSTYGYYRYKLIGNSQTKELKIYWTPTRIVDSFVFSSSFPNDISASRSLTPAQPPTRK